MYVLTYRVLLDSDGRSKFDDLSKWGLIKLLYSIKLVNWCCVKQCVELLYPKHISMQWWSFEGPCLDTIT